MHLSSPLIQGRTSSAVAAVIEMQKLHSQAGQQHLC